MVCAPDRTTRDAEGLAKPLLLKFSIRDLTVWQGEGRYLGLSLPARGGTQRKPSAHGAIRANTSAISLAGAAGVARTLDCLEKCEVLVAGMGR